MTPGERAQQLYEAAMAAKLKAEKRSRAYHVDNQPSTYGSVLVMQEARQCVALAYLADEAMADYKRNAERFRAKTGAVFMPKPPMP